MNIGLPLAAKCMHCGYLLRGLPEPRCPECGKPFMPGDPTTYLLEARSWWRRFYGRPPGRLHLTTILLITAYALVEASSPGLSPAFMCLLIPVALLALFLIGLDYMGRLVAWSYWHRRLDEESPPARPIRFKWIATPICVLLIGSLFLYPWSARMRFKISQSAFEVAVKGYHAGTLPSGAQWVGFYRVESISQQGSGYLFFKTGVSGFGDEDGFVHRTSRNPPEGRLELFLGRQLAPKWFIVHKSW